MRAQNGTAWQRHARAYARVSPWRSRLARVRNILTIILLAVAYVLRERRSWRRWQRRNA
jgi:hypothetical protein